jgi:hypothetical protein
LAKETEQSSEAKSKETKGSDSDAKEDGKCGNSKDGSSLSIVYWQIYSSSALSRRRALLFAEKAGKEGYS